MGYQLRCGTLRVRAVASMLLVYLAFMCTACKPRPAFKKAPAAQNTASRSTVTVPAAAKAYALKTQRDKQREREAATAGTMQYDEKGIAAMIRCRTCASKIANIASVAGSSETWVPQPEPGSGPTSSASSADPGEAVRAAKAQLGTDQCVCACFQSATGQWYAWAEAVR